MAMFDGPIPGQSLTTELGNSPWEQPPEMSKVEDVAKYYLEKLANPEVLDDFAAMCQVGIPLAPIVETVYLLGVSRGLHTIDAGLLVAPMIHEFLKAAITDMGITVKDSDDDPQERAEQAEMNRFLMLAANYLAEEGDDEADPGKAMIKEMVEAGEGETEEEPDQMEEPEEEMTEGKPMGLMAKG